MKTDEIVDSYTKKLEKAGIHDYTTEILYDDNIREMHESFIQSILSQERIQKINVMFIDQ
jgi:hypothetical protein